MTNGALANVSYEHRDRQDAFMKNEVASRLHDEEGTQEFETYLRGLAPKGFARVSLTEQ